MAYSENPAADFEDEGISIWLALAISIALLALGIWLTRSARSTHFIPSSGSTEEAFFNDVVNHALPDTPKLAVISGDPLEIIRWQKANKDLELDLEHLGLGQSVGASSFRWNGQTVSFTAMKVDSITAMIYCIEASWPKTVHQDRMMALQTQSRDIISWYNKGRFYVALPFEPGGSFPAQWKSWLQHGVSASPEPIRL